MRVALFQHASPLGMKTTEHLVARGGPLLVVAATPVPDAHRERVEALCRSVGAPIHWTATASDPALVPMLRTFAPDLLVVATFADRLPNALLALPRLDAINLHGSLLPRLRGAHPEFWALRRGLTETGLTAHRLTRRLDAGAILARTAVPLLPDDTLEVLCTRIAERAGPLLDGLLDRYAAGEVPTGEVQDESLATRARRVRAGDLRIDWTTSSGEILALLRAARPWMMPHSLLGDKMVGIATAIDSGQTSDREPGAVVPCAEGIGVVAGDGRILRVASVAVDAAWRPAEWLTTGPESVLI